MNYDENFKNAKFLKEIEKVKKYGLVHVTSREYKNIMFSMKYNGFQMDVEDFCLFIDIVIRSGKKDKMCQLLEAVTFCDMELMDNKETNDFLIAYKNGLEYVKECSDSRILFLRCIRFIADKYEKVDWEEDHKETRRSELDIYLNWVKNLNDVVLQKRILLCKESVEAEKINGVGTLLSRIIHSRQKNDNKKEKERSEEYEEIQKALNTLLKGEAIISGQIQALDINREKDSMQLINEVKKQNIEVHKVNEIISGIGEDIIVVSDKIDTIIAEISGLSNKIIDVKESRKLDINEKWNRIIDIIDDETKKTSYDKTQYMNIVKTWLGKKQFNELEELSKTYLINAEFLYENLQKLNTMDMSPYIAQYCKVLELEIKTKIFIPFVRKIKQNNNYKVIYAIDFNGSMNGKCARKLADSISKKQFHIELGTMAYTLKMVETGINSPLLNELKIYIESNFNKELISEHYFQKVTDIARNYRNAAAHTELIDLKKANLGKKDVREAIKFFSDMKK